MDVLTMERVCVATEKVVAGVRTDQHGLATPCTEWTVRDLLNHVLGTLHLGAALLSDRAPAGAIDPGGLPATDLAGDDPAGAYRDGVAALLAAARGDALQRTHSTPLGEMPGAVLGGFTTMDILVHGWDLARATGQPATLDNDLAGPLLAFAQQAITPDTRAPRIGPEVTAPAGAPAGDRLVAFLGRRP